MPSCFQLISKSLKEPVALPLVDRMICQRLEIPFDEDEWAADWYETIGFSLAVGRTYDELIDTYRIFQQEDKDCGGSVDYFQQLILIVALLKEEFEVKCWVER